MNNTLRSASLPPALAIPGDAPGAARTALKMLARLKHGSLTVQFPDGSLQRFGSGGAPMAVAMTGHPIAWASTLVRPKVSGTRDAITVTWAVMPIFSLRSRLSALITTV